MECQTTFCIHSSRIQDKNKSNLIFLYPKVTSEIVIWDYIIRDVKNAVVDLKDQPNKYGLVDLGNRLRDREITFKIKWNVMDNAGIHFFQESSYSKLLKLPSQYTQ